MAVFVLFLVVIAFVALVGWANSGEETKEDNNIKSDTSHGYASPNPSNFDRTWDNYHKMEKEAEIRYNNRPIFPTIEKKQVEIMYNYLIKNPNCTVKEMINWIYDTYKLTPRYPQSVYAIYNRWCSRGVLPYRRYKD